MLRLFYCGAQDSGQTAYVELGAGKGYLACLLAEAFPVRSLVLVDCGSFCRTADRCQQPALVPGPALPVLRKCCLTCSTTQLPVERLGVRKEQDHA